MKIRTLLRRPPPPVTPLPDQLIDAARTLTNDDALLADAVADLIPLAAQPMSDSVYGVFEDLIITLNWHQEDPDPELAADARSLIALAHKATAARS